MNIIKSPHLVKRVQFRFPKSKRRRIRKKWAKQSKNFKTIPLDEIYRMGNSFVMHPRMAERLRAKIQEDNEKTEENNRNSPLPQGGASDWSNVSRLRGLSW